MGGRSGFPVVAEHLGQPVGQVGLLGPPTVDHVLALDDELEQIGVRLNPPTIGAHLILGLPTAHHRRHGLSGGAQRLTIGHPAIIAGNRPAVGCVQACMIFDILLAVITCVTAGCLLVLTSPES